MITIARNTRIKAIWQQGKDVTIVDYKDLNIADSHKWASYQSILPSSPTIRIYTQWQPTTVFMGSKETKSQVPHIERFTVIVCYEHTHDSPFKRNRTTQW